ncbi:MAG: hypothetical protein CK425_00940 [Parachlamydia sp.]|nr:MAG: hypothetical protein CK425_00940 [Parachlamydia sp.]
MPDENLLQITAYETKTWESKEDIVVTNFHPNAVIHSPLGEFETASAMEEIVKVWQGAFPDLKVDYFATISEGDRVVRQWSASGTHLGDFLGLEPTQRPIHYQGCTIYKISNKKIVEYWCYINMEEIFAQLL